MRSQSTSSQDLMCELKMHDYGYALQGPAAHLLWHNHSYVHLCTT